MKAQKWLNTQNYILMILASIALGFFSAYSDLEENHWFLIGYLVFIVMAYAFYWLFIKGMNSHHRYLEFRLLAEGMRVQCYWYVAGIDESVGDNYTVKFQKDMFWATQAFKAWHVMDYLMHTDANGFVRLNPVTYTVSDYDNDYSKTVWLGVLLDNNDNPKKYLPVLPESLSAAFYEESPEQLKFFTSRINKFSKKNRHSKWWTIGVTLLVITMSIILAFLIWKYDFAHENWIVFLIGVLNIISLMITTNNNLNAYGELASKYSYCKLLAQKAVQDYEADNRKAKKIFKQFGIEALEENAEWLMIKNDREPAVLNN